MIRHFDTVVKMGGENSGRCMLAVAWYYRCLLLFVRRSISIALAPGALASFSGSGHASREKCHIQFQISPNIQSACGTGM